MSEVPLYIRGGRVGTGLRRSYASCLLIGPYSRAIFTYRGTSLVRKRTPLGPYSRPMPRVLGGS